MFRMIFTRLLLLRWCNGGLHCLIQSFSWPFKWEAFSCDLRDLITMLKYLRCAPAPLLFWVLLALQVRVCIYMQVHADLVEAVQSSLWFLCDNLVAFQRIWIYQFFKEKMWFCGSRNILDQPVFIDSCKDIKCSCWPDILSQEFKIFVCFCGELGVGRCNGTESWMSGLHHSLKSILQSLN